MGNNRKKNNKNLFVKLALIISIFLFLVKSECVIYAAPNNFTHSKGIEIVLIVSERSCRNFKFYEFQNFYKEIKNYTHDDAGFLSIRYSLIRYNNYIRQQLKSYKNAFSSETQIVSILQKNNIWHQSSDEDLLQFN